ncbi:MAG: hypothetical protein C4K58_00250 [Flavobacteriaceae bacterium]|nr:MAG: hypothetical protein C4K58_00250 [Flavobacteriaceae bacterium]
MDQSHLDFINKHFPKADSPIGLTGAGSDRKYFRFLAQGKSYILTLSENTKENQSFFYFASQFEKHQIPSPRVLFISQDQKAYIQEDLGSHDLFSFLMDKNAQQKELLELFKKSISELIKAQSRLAKDFDYSNCYDFQSFSKELVLHDLFYFKNYFLDRSPLEYSRYTLTQEFLDLSKKVASFEQMGFMFRDFQSRNIMIKDQNPYFIDFQGGMKGPGVYDLISLIWQAKAGLSTEFKEKCILHYREERKNQGVEIPQLEFNRQYQICLLLRLLQVLGAYGLRGLVENKPHFISSINFGLANLKEISNLEILDQYPVLKGVIVQLSHFNINENTQQWNKN